MVSIVIPVYNTEQYLDECIRSILNQTYTFWELILIDDGSVDGSKEICLKYQKEDERIRYFYQFNHGVSYARNQGIKHARGQYIYFMDSDDVADPCLLEKVLINVDGQDMVYFNIVSASEMKSECWVSKTFDGVTVFNEKAKRLEFILKHYLNFELCYSLWNKLYSLQIIRDNDIWLCERASIGEDLGFNLTFLLYAEKIKGIPDVLYKYRERAGSAMNVLGKRELRINDFSIMLEEIKNHADKIGINQKEFSRIFIKTMDNQYSRASSRKKIRAYIYAVENKKFFICQTVNALLHPLRFLSLFGISQAIKKWSEYLYILRCILFA